jgi:glycosyltransferase involved in cell wall biosynthesis
MDDKLCFLCFGGEDWWYHNRGHIGFQLTRRFARRGKVLYVNSIVMQKPNLRKGGKFMQKLVRKLKSIFKGVRKVEDNFWVYSPFSLPFHHIPAARAINEKIIKFQLALVMRRLGMKMPVVLVACPAACQAALMMPRRCLLYQRSDLYEAFPGVDRRIIASYDRRLKREADLTFFVNRKMLADEHMQCKRSIFLDHGVDFEMFARSDTRRIVPDDLRDIPRPIVGYFGTVNSHTVDVDLIARVAGLMPHVSFVLVGPVADDYKMLTSMPNIWMTGKKTYEQIPVYGRCFDVAIMAWQKTAWIESCNPVKLKEYLALGKPIVTTYFTELENYLDVVYTADTPEEFAASIKQALQEDSLLLAEQRKQKVRHATWDSKAELMMGQIATVSSGR